MLSLPREIIAIIAPNPTAARALHRTCTWMATLTRHMFTMTRAVDSDCDVHLCVSGENYKITAFVTRTRLFTIDGYNPSGCPLEYVVDHDNKISADDILVANTSWGPRLCYKSDCLVDFSKYITEIWGVIGIHYRVGGPDWTDVVCTMDAPECVCVIAPWATIGQALVYGSRIPASEIGDLVLEMRLVDFYVGVVSDPRVIKLNTLNQHNNVVRRRGCDY